MSEQKKQTFVKGAAILGLAGLIGKVIGAVYRIILFNVLTSSGVAYYETAYPIYSFLLVIATAGLPTAISKLVAERVAIGDYRGAHRTFQTAFKMLALIGLGTMVVLAAIAYPYAHFVKLDGAFWALLAIAPALFFVSIISAYRGYFQGLQMMTPTAGSQVIEQIGKFVFGYLLALLFAPRGLEFAAMGAVLGVSISEFFALVFLIVVFNQKKAGIKRNMRQHPQTRKDSPKALMKRILYVALPITIGASIMPLSIMMDTAIVMNRLTHAGFAKEMAQSLYGIYTGSIMAIVNMPAVISLSFGMSLVPAVSAALAKKDRLVATTTSKIGVKLALLFGLPCVVGLFLCAQPVLGLLFGRSLTAVEMRHAVELLQIMSVAVLFLTIVQTMTSIIQGYGKYMVPIFSLCVGALGKLITSFVLVGNAEVNIKGAAFGTLVCYGIAGLINMAVVFRLAKLKFSILDYIIRPVVSTGIMAAVVYFLLPVVTDFAGANLGLMATILVAMLAYLLAVLVTGSLQPDDMEFIPGGGALTRLLYRMHIWRKK